MRTTSSTTSFGCHWILISALCTVDVAFFSSNNDTCKLKCIHITFGSYFTCVTRSLLISSVSAHSYTSFRWLVSNGFPFFRLSYQLSEVGWSLSGFFLLIWLSRTTISPPSTISCILVLPLSVSFILVHILWRHNHWDIVSHNVLRLCVVSAFCMSYLVCDAFQDVWCVVRLAALLTIYSPSWQKRHLFCYQTFWCSGYAWGSGCLTCVLSYFGNFHCVEASQPETIEVTLSRFFLMHSLYSISLWCLFFSSGTCLIDAVPDYSVLFFFYVMRFGTFTSIRSVSLNALDLS